MILLVIFTQGQEHNMCLHEMCRKLAFSQPKRSTSCHLEILKFRGREDHIRACIPGHQKGILHRPSLPENSIVPQQCMEPPDLLSPNLGSQLQASHECPPQEIHEFRSKVLDPKEPMWDWYAWKIAEILAFPQHCWLWPWFREGDTYLVGGSRGMEFRKLRYLHAGQVFRALTGPSFAWPDIKTKSRQNRVSADDTVALWSTVQKKWRKGSDLKGTVKAADGIKPNLLRQKMRRIWESLYGLP